MKKIIFLSILFTSCFIHKGRFINDTCRPKVSNFRLIKTPSKPEWQIYKEEISYTYTTLGTPILHKNKIMLPSYGDDPRDQKWIMSGFKYFKKQ